MKQKNFDGRRARGCSQTARKEKQVRQARAGAVIRDTSTGHKLKMQAQFDGPQTVPNAEAVACEMAITEASAAKAKGPLHVFIDASVIIFGLRKYKEAPTRMTNNPLRPTYARIAKIIKENDMDVTFHKIYSHTGIAGNDEADALANAARKETDREGEERGRDR